MYGAQKNWSYYRAGGRELTEPVYERINGGGICLWIRYMCIFHVLKISGYSV